MGHPYALATVFHEAAISPQEHVTVRELVGRIGSRAHGFAILLLALPEALPLPIPSFGIVLAVPLVAICAHLILFGEGGGLPRKAAEATVSTSVLRTIDEKLGPVLRAADRLAVRRWTELARHERLIGLVCLYSSVLLVLPVPFFNIPPAACLVLLAWGMVQRDGAAVLAGLLGTAMMTLALIWSADMLWNWWTTRH